MLAKSTTYPHTPTSLLAIRCVTFDTENKSPPIRPANVVAVALAHKLVRTAWALVAHGRSYDNQWHSVPPERQTAQAMATP